MKLESFQIQMNWLNNPCHIEITSAVPEGNNPVISLYMVFRENAYLFSIYPVIKSDASKAWRIVEKDREDHLPPGFVAVLGNLIDDYYINYSN